MIDRKGNKIKKGDVVIVIKDYVDGTTKITKGTVLTTQYDFEKTIDVVVNGAGVQLNSKYVEKKLP